MGGWGGQVSLEPTGPGESAGLCPNPPARPSQLLLWCVVRASLVMCSLRFSKIRGLVARLTAPPSSALHLRVGEGSSRVPPTAGPQPSWSPVLSLPVTLRKDSGGPARDQGTAGTCPQLRVLSRQPGFSRPRHGALAPAPSPQGSPRKHLHILPLGSLGPLKDPGGSPAPRCVCDPSPYAAALRSFQKF